MADDDGGSLFFFFFFLLSSFSFRYGPLPIRDHLELCLFLFFAKRENQVIKPFDWLELLKSNRDMSRFVLNFLFTAVLLLWGDSSERGKVEKSTLTTIWKKTNSGFILNYFVLGPLLLLAVVAVMMIIIVS